MKTKISKSSSTLRRSAVVVLTLSSL